MNLSNERFLKVIASLDGIEAVDSEQRGNPRVSLRASVRIAPFDGARLIEARCLDALGLDAEPGPAYAVRVQDICAQGVAIQHHRSLLKGSPFVLDLPERADAGGTHEVSRMRVLCRVLHSRMTAEHRFSIGAQFVRLWTAPAPTLDVAVAMSA